MTGPHRRLLSLGLVLILMVTLFGLSACSAEKAGYDAAYPNAAPPELDEHYSIAESEAGETGSAARYRIRTGSLDLTVTDTRKTVQQVQQIAASAGGYLSDSNIYTVKEDLYHASLTLRIPEDRFDAVLEQLQDLGKFTGVRTEDDDVTMSYLDLEARLETLQAQEARLREILAQAETVEEILSVEQQLQRIRQDIESLTAQFKYLQDQVNFATITVGLREEKIATTAVTPAPFADLGARMKTGLVGSVNFVLSAIAGAMVVLVALLPVAIVLGLVILALWWIINRFSRRRHTPPPANSSK